MLSFPTEISDIFHACYTDLFNKYVPSHASKGKNHSATADSNTGSKSWRAVRVHLKNGFFSQFKFVRWCKKILFWHWVWESKIVLDAKLLWPTWLLWYSLPVAAYHIMQRNTTFATIPFNPIPSDCSSGGFPAVAYQHNYLISGKPLATW